MSVPPAGLVEVDRGENRGMMLPHTLDALLSPFLQHPQHKWQFGGNKVQMWVRSICLSASVLYVMMVEEED